MATAEVDGGGNVDCVILWIQGCQENRIGLLS